MELSSAARAAFWSDVWAYYHESGRHDLPWRHDTSPYSITISEVMLQQTQVARVLIKYPEFLAMFPSFDALASADLVTVLAAWQGMGYNRRARFLQQLAQRVQGEFNGDLPHDPQMLLTLPGIGKATAASIAAFAFNAPTVFIETNIRRVYIHHFFPGQAEVHDRDIQALVESTLDTARPREWYWALMDYGSYLAKSFVNPNRNSKHYQKQSKFSGSVREARGAILRLLVAGTPLTAQQMVKRSLIDRSRLLVAIEQLGDEGFIQGVGRGRYMITSQRS